MSIRIVESKQQYTLTTSMSTVCQSVIDKTSKLAPGVCGLYGLFGLYPELGVLYGLLLDGDCP